MTISFILVLELSGKKRRGLYIGLVNTGFTTGVSLGAVIAGALLPVMGWVIAIPRGGYRRFADDFAEILVLDPRPFSFDIWPWDLL
jgi:MFS family permease